MRRVAVYEDEENMQPRKRRILFPVLITLFSVIFVVSAAVLIIELIVNPYVTDKNVGEIQKIYSEAGDTESVAPVSSEDGTADSERMAELERRREAVLKLQSVNSDITGWVQLDGTDINFPVLTPPADDPQYYLYRNYKKESTKYGSIFLDGMCTVDSDNQVLHGHSMQDGRMFWQVIGFGSAETVKGCPVSAMTPKRKRRNGRSFRYSRRIHTIIKGNCSTICAAILTLRKIRCSFTTT